MASKFSTPFMAKSPLYGAYESGAGGKVYVSNRRAFEKLQDDIVSGTKSAIAGEEKKKKDKESLFKQDGTLKVTFDEKYKNKENKNKISFEDSVDIPSGLFMLDKCPKGKVRSKINKKCVSKKGAGKEYDK
jgi:hypothetical protein